MCFAGTHSRHVVLWLSYFEEVPCTFWMKTNPMGGLMDYWVDPPEGAPPSSQSKAAKTSPDIRVGESSTFYFVNKAQRLTELARRLQPFASFFVLFPAFAALGGSGDGVWDFSMAASTFSSFLALLLVSLATLCRTLASDSDANADANETQSPPKSNSTTGSGSGRGQGGLTGFGMDSSMMRRAAYVLIAITAMGFLYFIARAGCVKKMAPRKKYGLLSHSEDTMELTAAAASDDEDDNTLYEARPLRR
ncbi:protein FAM174C [Stigmatopora argus]